jgi:hypothetical protein
MSGKPAQFFYIKAPGSSKIVEGARMGEPPSRMSNGKPMIAWNLSVAPALCRSVFSPSWRLASHSTGSEHREF